ncbi:hypothetical protein JCM14635_36440 [Megalodesulfovibrio paquesii]
MGQSQGAAVPGRSWLHPDPLAVRPAMQQGAGHGLRVLLQGIRIKGARIRPPQAGYAAHKSHGVGRKKAARLTPAAYSRM